MKNSQLAAGLLVLVALVFSTTSNAYEEQDATQLLQTPRSISRRQVAEDVIDQDVDRSTAGRNFLKDCMRSHNMYRERHGAPPLVFSRKIARFAQKRADFIADSDGAEFRHPPDLPYGENLAYHSLETTSCSELVRLWYDEVSMYNFFSGGFSMSTGHFTQVVWKGTKQVGCGRGVSTGPNGGVTLVCNYYPPGNIIGQFQENVSPASSRDIGDGERNSGREFKKRKRPTTPSITDPITSFITSIFGSTRSGLEDEESKVTKPYKKRFSASTESSFIPTSTMAPQLNQSSREGRTFNFESRRLNGFSRVAAPVTESYLTRTSSVIMSNSTTTTTTTTTSYLPESSRQPPKKVKKIKKNPNNGPKRTKKKVTKPEKKPVAPATSLRPKLSDAMGGVTAASKSTTTTTTTTSTKKPTVSKLDSKPSSSVAAKENDQLRWRNVSVVDKDKSSGFFTNSTTAKPRARKRRRRARNNSTQSNSTSGRSTNKPSNVRPSKLQLTPLRTTNSNTTSTTTTTSTTKRPS